MFIQSKLVIPYSVINVVKSIISSTSSYFGLKNWNEYEILQIKQKLKIKICMIDRNWGDCVDVDIQLTNHKSLAHKLPTKVVVFCSFPISNTNVELISYLCKYSSDILSVYLSNLLFERAHCWWLHKIISFKRQSWLTC